MVKKARQQPDFEKAWEMLEGTIPVRPAAPVERRPSPSELLLEEQRAAEELKLLSPMERLERLRPHEKRRILNVAMELQRRSIESTALYEPMPRQMAFHQSKARVRLMGGGNRGGKTLCGMMEIAWLVRGNHPYYQYNRKGGQIYLVGRDEKHIADVLGRKLLQEGGGDGRFRRIRDLLTGEWRAFRLWEDDFRADESKPMPPLIPSYMIKGRPHYSDKNRGVISMLRLNNGWELNFYTGGSDPPQGSAPFYIHLDEEITNRRWLTEMMARVTDQRGRITWSATAEVGGESLWNLHMMCMKDLEKPEADRLFQEFHVSAAINDHLGAEAKAEMEQMLATDPLAYATKWLGEYALESYRVYAGFSPKTHVCEAFTPPDNWCRYMLVDPGHVRLAVTFVAVPPPSDEVNRGHHFVFNEIYMRDTNAVEFGKAVKEAIGAQTFEDFIIDWAGSRRTEMGGDTIREQLEQALVANGVRCIRRGSNFQNGSDNLDSGILRVKEWLLPVADGRPKLMLMRGMCKNTELEFQRYHYKKDAATGLSTGKPNQTGIHCLDTLRYGVMHGMPYVKPKDLSKRKSPTRRYLDDKKKRQPRDSSLYLMAGTGPRS